jgi:hypothetical protein
LGDDAFLLGVHYDSDKPPNVEPGFYEVGVLGEGIDNSRGPLEGDFRWNLSRFTTKRGFTRKTQSLRLGARRSHLGGLGRLSLIRHTSHTRAGSHLGGGIRSRC